MSGISFSDTMPEQCYLFRLNSICRTFFSDKLSLLFQFPPVLSPFIAFVKNFLNKGSCNGLFQYHIVIQIVIFDYLLGDLADIFLFMR